LGIFSTAVAFLALAAASAETVSVGLVFVPATDQLNRVRLTLSVTALAVPKTDTEYTAVTGNALADLTVAFNHATHEAIVTGLEFTGGTYAFSSVRFDLDYGLLGGIHATADNIGGTLDTPSRARRGRLTARPSRPRSTRRSSTGAPSTRGPAGTSERGSTPSRGTFPKRRSPQPAPGRERSSSLLPRSPPDSPATT